MKKQNNRQKYNTPYQLKLPVEISRIIEISDPVYTFSEVMDCIDLKKYLAAPESRTGRKRYNS
ncbi:MAG: IS1182 family transposase, partial [Acutalibacteraceae bacterium]|nr:IS1182 family transposase [Acutalibacteraceae bacterium]